MLIIVFILGFVFGAFSPILPDLSATLIDILDHARPQGGVRNKGRR